ncbi:uncharacterized protein P884DRAFT_237025 [Thermothelomyces heterothallicus CBS 202.75]|uniref:uncharacterized protein n=1 Tax=Thermothelomyces heterothallicus CBS 202.75 TaxID=1149848 RepID=UPI00374309B8
MDAADRQTSEQPKRRACDECRGRKLACSKEIDGCARCKREGIKCVYSPQKRMGRPRKHRPVEVAAPPTTAAKTTEAPPESVQPFVVPDFQFDGAIGMDLDLSFLDMSNKDMNFLEIVDPNTQFPPPPAQNSLDSGTDSFVKQAETARPPGVFWPMSGNLGDINFDEPPPGPTPQPAPEITAEEVAQMLSGDLERLPSLSPPSATSPSTHASPSEPDRDISCSCLSSLYLALDSLRTLPKDVPAAMRVARTAAKAAHDTVLCPVCGDPPIDPHAKSSIQAFQSIMMLGALLPSLSNAYMRILTMVDAEAAAADREGRQIPFMLSSYGGLWGWMAKMDSSKCNARERLEGAMLDPLLWRLTVRSLLKLDVYGINECTPGAEGEGAQQPGLKDIIAMLEERSRRRHEQLDALIEAGVVKKDQCGVGYVSLSSETEKPTCLRIIDIAKRSMDELVIP